MTRVFATWFSYNGDSYTAVISQLDGAVNIYVSDESLHGILPSGKARFNREQGLKIDRPRLSPTQHLLLNILTDTELLLQKPIKAAEANA